MIVSDFCMYLFSTKTNENVRELSIYLTLFNANVFLSFEAAPVHDKVQKEVQTKMAFDKLLTMLQELKVKGHHEQAIDSSAESEKTNEQLRIETIIGKSFEDEQIFGSREFYNLTIKGCTFKKNVQFLSYKGATVNLVDCYFREKFILKCFGKVDVKIENGIFIGLNTIILHDKSSIRLKNTTYHDDFYLLARSKIELIIENGQFSKKKKLQCLDETVLILDKNIYNGNAFSEFRGVAKMDIRRCCFKFFTNFIFSNDATVILNESDFYEDFRLKVHGRAESIIKKSYFNKGDFDFYDRVLFKFQNNHCRQEICFQGFEKTDAIVKKCVFDKATKLYFRDDASMKFFKNECKNVVTFEHWDEFNVTEEKNNFVGEKKSISHGK